MNFFTKQEQFVKSKLSKTKLSGASLIALGMLGAASKAQAQDADISPPDGYKDVNTVKDISTAVQNADGTVEVTLQSGDKITFAANEVALVNGQIFLSEAALQTAGITVGAGIGAGTIVILGGLLGAGVGLAASGESDDGPTVPENAAPNFTSDESFSVVENQTVAFTAVATDADAGDTLTYSLSGDDADLFSIDADTGVVTFVTEPDFETPADADGDNVFAVTVNASDGTETTSQDVLVTVTDENEAPEISLPEDVVVDEETGAVAVEVSENQNGALTLTALDDDNDQLSFSLTGADADLFSIDPLTGIITFLGSPDFEMPADADGDNVFEVTVTATDGQSTTSQAVMVTVTNVNEAPEITSATAVNAAENQTAALTVEATDIDGDTLTYSLAGADAGLFAIDAATGVITFVAAPDFEAPADADGDNVFALTVNASDGTETTSQDVLVTVTDVNEAPVITSAAAVDAAENQAAVLTAAATDVDGDTLTYSLAGADAALFAIDAATGVITFVAAPDFEAPADADGDNVFALTVNASDGTETTSQDVLVTVTDVNEAPVITSAAAVDAAENQAAVLTAAATDVDGDTLTYSLAGADAALFAIDAATGVITFVAAPDFEAPADADGDNVFALTVNASDGTETTSQDVLVTVTDVNEAPVITSAAAFDAAENQTAALTVEATDIDGDTLTYSLAGADAGLFAIDAATGVITFVAAPDFEAPADADGDNVFALTVNASDGTETTSQDVLVTVTDVNEAPVITSAAAFDAAENQTAVLTAAATDVDGDALTYSLAGADAALFAIDAATGVITFVAAPDFEAPADADGDNVFALTVNASDGTETTSQDVLVTVTDVNEAPVITSAAAVDAAENQAAVLTAAATDVDGDTLTYSLAGADAALFAIDAATGVITFVAVPDFEAPADTDGDNVFALTVNASDGTETTSQDVLVTVTDVNEAPVITSAAAVDAAENQAAVLTAAATDVDGDTLTYSLAGADAALFAIDAATGVITFVAVPDFEAPADTDGDNVFALTVNASDGTETTSQDVLVTVTDVNEAPVITSAAAFDAAENQTAVLTAAATDVDGDALTYSLAGADAALFAIDAATGVITFVAAPDFEAPADADGDNVFALTVNASDGTETTSQDVLVTLTDVNEAPVFNLPTTAFQFNEGEDVSFALSAIDPESDDVTFEITGGADQDHFADFSIVDGALIARISPITDFFLPSADGDDVYELEITATDSAGNTAIEDVTLEALDIDLVPFINTPSTNLTFTDEQIDTELEFFAFNDEFEQYTVILGGEDAGLFSLNGVPQPLEFFIFNGVFQGLITPNSDYDFDNPLDSDGDNVYNFEVIVSDGINVDVTDFVIEITDGVLSQNAPVITSPTTNMVNEDERIRLDLEATDADGDELFFSVVGGADADQFGVVDNQLFTFLVPDFENPFDADFDNILEVEVLVDDATGNSTTQLLTFEILDVDPAPVITAESAEFAENSQDFSINYEVVDPELEDITVSLAGPDAMAFSLIDFVGFPGVSAGELFLNILPDFDMPTDADGDNVYTVDIVASDGVNPDVVQTVNFTILPPNFGPVFTSVAEISIDEGVPLSFTLAATDPEGEDVTYSILGGDGLGDEFNDPRFTIEDNILSADLFHFDFPTDEGLDNIYEVIVGATDSFGNITEQTITITVNDIDLVPYFSNIPASYEITEGDIFAQSPLGFAVDDVDDNPITVTFTGDDVALFDFTATPIVDVIIQPSGNPLGDNTVVRFEVEALQAFDFENPLDADGDNVYTFDVNLSDGTQSSTQTYTLTVLDLFESENAPVFTSADSITVPSASFDHVFTATDLDGELPFFEVTGGPDADLFRVSGPDVLFANSSSLANGTYNIEVTAFDGSGNSTIQNLEIVAVNSAPEFDVITTDFTVFEGDGQFFFESLFIADADDDDTLSFSVSGDDVGLFTISEQFFAPGNLELSIEANLDLDFDFEDPQDANDDNVYEFTIEATDGTDTVSQDFTVTIEDDISDNISPNAPEFVPTTPESSGGMITQDLIATDADGDIVTFEITGGDDQFDFFISPGDILEGFPAGPSADGDNIFNVEVTAFDGTGNSTVEVFNFTLVNALPTFETPVDFSILEEEMAFLTFGVMDDDPFDFLNLTLTGPDAALFSLSQTSGNPFVFGEILLAFTPDFENPQDVGGDNQYDFTIEASDGTDTVSQNYTLTVMDDPADNGNTASANAPEFTSDAMISLLPFSQQHTLAATDADGDMVTFEITGGDDEFEFFLTGDTIDFFPAVPQQSSDGDNIFSVEVTAFDGTGNSTTQNLEVTPINTPPSFFSGDTDSIITEGDTITNLFLEGDSGDMDFLTFTITGPDAEFIDITPDFIDFIVSAPINLTIVPDFDNPVDNGIPNVFEFTINLSDGTDTTSQDFTVTIENDPADDVVALTKPSFEVLDDDVVNLGDTSEMQIDVVSSKSGFVEMDNSVLNADLEFAADLMLLEDNMSFADA